MGRARMSAWGGSAWAGLALSVCEKTRGSVCEKTRGSVWAGLGLFEDAWVRERSKRGPVWAREGSEGHADGDFDGPRGIRESEGGPRGVRESEGEPTGGVEGEADEGGPRGVQGGSESAPRVRKGSDGEVDGR